MERGACAHWQPATLNAPLDRHRRGHLPHGVASNGLFSEKLPRDRLQGVHPDLVRVVERAIEIATQNFRIQEPPRAKGCGSA
jgi:hypothetical protein